MYVPLNPLTFLCAGDPGERCRHRPPGAPAHAGHRQRGGPALHQQQDLGVCTTRLEGRPNRAAHHL